MRIAVTGSSGYVGTCLLGRLAGADWVEAILAVDLRPPPRDYPGSVTFARRDVRGDLGELLRGFEPDAVVHLAFVLELAGLDRRMPVGDLVEAPHQLPELVRIDVELRLHAHFRHGRAVSWWCV